MSPDFVLGFDVGSSSAKVCALTLGGAYLGIATEAYPTRVPHPAWAEQEAAAWLPALIRACGRLFGENGLDGKRARGIAITSAAHVGVLLDAGHRVIRPSILWHDQRSAEESAELAERHGEEIFSLSNNWPTPTWTLPHLCWIRRHEPENWDRVRHFLLSKDYVAYLLTGRFATDPAAAVSAQLLDASSMTWSSRLCELAELPASALPEIVAVGGFIGTVLPHVAERFGISPETAVYSGTMDSTAETFAAGVRRESECVIRLASAGGIHGIASPPMAHRMLISYPYPMEPYWLSQAGTNTCASAVAWAYKACMPDDGNPADYTVWETLAAAAPPGSGGVLFHPYLAGERCPYWDGSLRAGFTGLSLHSGKKELARAVYEGTAFSLRDALHVLEEKGFVLNGIRLVGGGAKSALWSEIVSTVLGCAACLVPEADSSAGAALFALLGTGHFSALEEVPANLFARLGNECVPNEAWRDACEAAFARYKDGQKKLAELARP